MKSKIPLAIILSILALSLAADIYFIANAPKPEYKFEEIIVGKLSNGGDSAIITIARNQGYFIENGLRVTWKEYESSIASMHALQSGQVNTTIVSEYVFAEKAFDQEDLRIIASITTADIYVIAARKDKNISKPSDLKGKKIGITFGSAAEYYLKVFLEKNHLTFSEVSPVNLNTLRISESLNQGSIDAAVIIEPLLSSSQDLIIWPAQPGHLYYLLLVTKDNTIKSRPQIIQPLLESLVYAEKFVEESPAEAQEIIKAYYDDNSFKEEIWQKYTFEVSLSKDLLDVMENEAKWIMQNNLTHKTKIPDFQNMVYKEGVKAVKPEAVSI